jgi:tetratricopeptide (TPR) repeat protein
MQTVAAQTSAKDAVNSAASAPQSVAQSVAQSIAQAVDQKAAAQAPTQPPAQVTATPADRQSAVASAANATQVTRPPAEAPSEAPSEALKLQTLLQQIEALKQQNASSTILANAYRTLGNFYRDRIEQGENAPQNLTTAIEAYEQVIPLLPQTSPLWMDVLNDLGSLYWMLSRSPYSFDVCLEYLLKAIKTYQQAIAKVDPQSLQETYPLLQNNLGAAYADLARYQDPADNLRFSIQAYEESLRIRPAQHDPARYASTQNNLGTTYWNLAQHENASHNLKAAITAYSDALTYYRPAEEPLNYAMIQNNLGTAYWNLAQRERPKDWLLLAVSAYQIALQYRTLDVAPSAYAATQNNLGTAYWHLANHAEEQSEKMEYLQQAIAAYEATLKAAERLALLQVSNPSQVAALSFDLFATHNNLGLTFYQIATDAKANLETSLQSDYLEAALMHHILAIQGWAEKPELRQTAMNCIIQTTRGFYQHLGLNGQNKALSIIPGQLLSEVLPKL